jgi:hypothetical protein
MLEAVRDVRLVSRVIWIKGTLNTLLGALHIVGTFTFEAEKVAGRAGALMQRDYLVWFFGVGVFIVFLGLVDLLCSRGLREGDSSAWRMALLCSLFTAAIGTTGVAIYGVSPPLQLLCTGVLGLAVLTLSRGVYREDPS